MHRPGEFGGGTQWSISAHLRSGQPKPSASPRRFRLLLVRICGGAVDAGSFDVRCRMRAGSRGLGLLRLTARTHSLRRFLVRSGTGDRHSGPLVFVLGGGRREPEKRNKREDYFHAISLPLVVEDNSVTCSNVPGRLQPARGPKLIRRCVPNGAPEEIRTPDP
jgi:hypothetical protein